MGEIDATGDWPSLLAASPRSKISAVVSNTCATHKSLNISSGATLSGLLM